MSIFSHPNITSAMKGLQSNVAYKLLFVNLTSMVIPRIYIDSRRNKYAGQETAFYELYSTVTNYALPGLLALGTAQAFKKFKNPLDIDTTGWVGNEHIQALSDIYKQSVQGADKEKTLKEFVTKTLNQLKGIDSASAKETLLSHKLSDDAIQKQLAKPIAKLIRGEELSPEAQKKIVKTLSESLGTFDNVFLTHGKDLSIGKGLKVNPEKLVQHISYLGKQFQKAHTKPNVKATVEAIAGKLRMSNNAKAAVGLTVVSSLGFFAQFLNKWITQYRTGKTGFVGYTDFGKDSKNSANVAQNTPLMNGPIAPTARPQLRFGGLESSQFLPTGDQLKYTIYPAGIIGKLLASRCWDEARETATKAGFAYFNFLFIPNLVENLAAHVMGNKNIFSKAPALEGSQKSGFGKLKHTLQSINKSNIRSYQDIEIYAKRMGTELKNVSGIQLKEKLKGVVNEPETLMKTVGRMNESAKAKKLTKVIAEELNGIRNKAALSGILYSCATLGIGLNLLNAYITRKKEMEKEKAIPKPETLPTMPTFNKFSGLPVFQRPNYNASNGIRPYQFSKPFNLYSKIQ